MKKIRLQYVLFIGFTLISSIPVLFLTSWVQQSALEKEVAGVKEKHLLVARNLTGDLTRYVTDVESAFRLISKNLASNNKVLGLPALLKSLDFRYFLVVNSDAHILSSLSPVKISSKTFFVPKVLTDEITQELIPILKRTKHLPNKVFFSNLIRDTDGETTFFLLKRIDDTRYAIGSISTQHIRDAQKAVIFGNRGHAAIVDRTGRAIAHPIADWVATMKDMSFLPPVKKMMQGKTGVSQFYTPAMKADMVAGYTFVPKAGWGVMIPQPFEELEERANDVQKIALLITALGFSVAGLLGWFLARKLSLPIQSVVDSTLYMQRGNTLKVVSQKFKFIPYELQSLISSFNRMVIEIIEKSSYLEDTSTRLAEAQRIAHVGNWELDFENDKLWCSDEFYRICDVNLKYFGGTYQELLELVHPEDRKLFESSIKQAREQGGRFNIEHRLIRPDFHECIVHHEGEMQIDANGKPQHMIGVMLDITERHIYEKKLSYQANYDDLTGLPNRNLLLDRLNQEFLNSQRTSKKVGLLSIDLDMFKSINDTHGQIFGDKLLKKATDRICACVRASDTIARPGGDEFIVILRDILKESDCSLIAENIVKSMQEPFVIDNTEAFIGASIGITIYPNDADDTISILRNADIALFRAKENGRNNFCFFKEEMDQEISNRVALSNDLRKAVEQNELSVYYQPIVDLKTGMISSAEALVRWTHPQRGFISPVEFIPIAEDTGAIGPLGLFVLKEACINAASWEKLTDKPPRVSVNLSVKQLKLGLSKDVITDIITSSGLPANRLTFEITESMFMNDMDATIIWIESIRDFGISFSVDDFGTGYSSLSYLKRLPVDILKIDRAFVKDVLINPEDASLVETIIAIGNNLNLKIVAEGAEEKEQIEYLAKVHCDYIQGYYFSKPVPADEFATLIENWVPQRFV